MKTRMRGWIALMLAAMLALGAGGLAEETVSEAFRLSGVTERPASGEVGADSTAGATPEASGAQQGSVDLPEPVQYRVNLDASYTLDVYAERNLQAQVVAQLHGEDIVDVTGYEGDWSKVLLSNGAVGYVPSMYLTSAESIMDSAPVIDEQPAGSEQSAGSEEVAGNGEASAAPEAEEKPAVSKFPEPVKYQVNLDPAQLADVFVEPTASSRLIAQMYGGFEVDVTGYAGDWFEICLPNGMVGFVESRLLTEVLPEGEDAPKAPAEPEATEEPAEDAAEEPADESAEDVPAEPETSEEPESEPTEEPAAEPEQPQGVPYRVSVTKVNVRSGPSTDAAILGQAWQDYVFNVIGAEGDWYQILLDDGRTAYVKSEYMTKVGEPEPEPTEEPEPEATEEPEAAPSEEPAPTEEPTEEPEAAPSEEPTEEPAPEPTEEPADNNEETDPEPAPAEDSEAADDTVEPEQPAEFEYERNEDGSLALDEAGNPILIDADGAAVKPTAYLRDADGNLMLDENGNPIPTDVEVEEAEQPEEAPAEGELNPNRMVIVTPDLGGQEPHLGMEVRLVATVVGYEGVDYTLQWQKSTDNVNWTDVPGETGETCNVVVDEESCMEIWRAVAIVTDASEA